MRLEVCVVNLCVKAVLLNVACTSETACLTHTMVSTSLIYTLSKLQHATTRQPTDLQFQPVEWQAIACFWQHVRTWQHNAVCI